MKKFYALLLVLLMILSMVACGNSNSQTDNEIPEDTPNPEESQNPEETLTEVHSRFSEVYVRNTDEVELETIEITQFADFLIIEHGQWCEGDLYSYWVDEFWPDNSADLYSDIEVISGHYASFSNMSNAGMYWESPASMTLILQEEKLTVSGENDGNAIYTASEDELRIHKDVHQYAQQLGTQPDRSLVGNWYVHENGYTVFLRLYEDGTVQCVSKTMEMPVVVLNGIWGSSNGELDMICIQAGCGDVPVEISWNVSINNSELVIDHGADTAFPWEGKSQAIIFQGLPSIPSPA